MMNVFGMRKWMERLKNSFLNRHFPGESIFVAGMILALETSGCVHSSQRSVRGGAEVLLPKLTAMTTGPVAILLTNRNAFRADFTMTLAEVPKPPLVFLGQIIVSGTKLRLETSFNNSKGTSKTVRDFGLIWDAAQNQGFAFCEALQGYAPINTTVHFTNLLTQVIAGQTERFQGHPIDKANVTVMGSDGQTASIELLRVQALDNLPLRMSFSHRSNSVTLAVSNIQWCQSSKDLFMPPEEFTKYESEAAMLDELTARQHSVSSGGRGAGAMENHDGAGKHDHNKDNP
jgi:hypothetical protein